MSGTDDSGKPRERVGGLDFDLDEALTAWEQEFQGTGGTKESTGSDGPSEPPRRRSPTRAGPLYRPPSPEEIDAEARGRSSAPPRGIGAADPAPGKPTPVPPPGQLRSDREGGDAARAVRPALIDTFATEEAESPAHDPGTSSVGLDLDDLLGDFDVPTHTADADAKAAPPPVAPGEPSLRGTPSGPEGMDDHREPAEHAVPPSSVDAAANAGFDDEVFHPFDAPKDPVSLEEDAFDPFADLLEGDLPVPATPKPAGEGAATTTEHPPLRSKPEAPPPSLDPPPPPGPRAPASGRPRSVPGRKPPPPPPPAASKRPPPPPPPAARPAAKSAEPPPPPAKALSKPPAPPKPPPPRKPQAPTPKSAPSSPAPDDQGAAAARRTVRYRKPREEHFPLVGHSAEAQRARREMLVTLADSASGPARARLLVAAAEMSEQLGEQERSANLYAEARTAHPRDVLALRARRRAATADGDWPEVASLLEAEAALALAPADKALVLAALAELQLGRLGDAAGAERSARAALAAHRRSVPAALVLAQACAAQERERDVAPALEMAMAAWDDGAARAALAVQVARRAERAGHQARALKHYAAAVEADPSALDALWGLVRTSRAAGQVDQTVEALERAAALLPPAGADAARRLGARLLHVVAHRPVDGLGRLTEARSVLSLATRAELARGADDPQTERAAVEAWAAASGGTERALALVMLAELRAAEGDVEGADGALRDAALADEKLGTVRVVREVLARRVGDPGRFSHAVEGVAQGASGGAIAAAAKIAREKGNEVVVRERELLSKAADEGDSPVTADVLGLDISAGMQDAEATRYGLTRQAERATPEQKLGPSLAVADLLLARDDRNAAVELLREARDASPGDPLVLHPLADLLRTDAPREAAALWLEEAAAANGERAAYAATEAGRLLAASGSDATGALHRALDTEELYLPAAWTLEPLARASDDTTTLQELQERIAQLGGDPVDVAGRWIRAALLRGEQDPDAARILLERAREQQPSDPILHELLLRLAGTGDASDRAALLESMADHLPVTLARVARQRAAVGWEDAGEPARAAKLYRAVLEEHPDDPFASTWIDRAELAAGEQARVAERRFAAVKSARDENARVAALEALAALDLHWRDDVASAVLSLQSILEHKPGHLPSLRTLERHFMDQRRDDDLLAVEEALADHIEQGPDVAGHARLAARLRLVPGDARGDAADEVLLSAWTRTRSDLWLARRVEGVSRGRNDWDRLSEALAHIADRLDGPLERAAAAVRAAELLQHTHSANEAADRLRTAVSAAPDHPVAAEELARLSEASGYKTAAGEAYEVAAKASRVERRRAALWYQAGRLWEEAHDTERALAAYDQASEIDIAYHDVFDRMRRLLSSRGETARLAALIQVRLAAGGDTDALVDLHLARADLCEDIGDRDGTKEALRAALALRPEHVEALKKLTSVSLEDGHWRQAAEALIRIARLRQEREELRWVFFTLGDIYDVHMPDPRRAEAAYRRVLKLVPDDAETLKRLAELHRREERFDDAVATLRTLARDEVDPDKNREHRARLAEVLEEQGDLRGAESELEHARRNAPTDIEALRALAAFYRRQAAHSALAMHLNRAVLDFRQAIESDPTDVSAWHGLVEVLSWRGRDDAARCCASAALALGLVDVELSQRLDEQGGVPGAGSAAADPVLDEVLAPPLLTSAARRVLRTAAEALHKVIGFDARALQPEKIGNEGAFRAEARQVSEWFGVDVQLVVTQVAPRICIPLTGPSNVTVAVGRDLLHTTDERERLFLLTRAVKIAVTQLSITVQAQPEDLIAAIGGLVRAYEPGYAPPGVDPARLEDLSRRVLKALPRRARNDLAPFVMEMANSPDFDAGALGLAACELGDRVALIAIGSAPAAFSALLELDGRDLRGSLGPSQRTQAIGSLPEARSLLSFSVSDAHFDARQRIGADQLSGTGGR